MTLIIEDGSRSDPTANSYVTRQALIDYAAAAGTTVTDDETADHAVVKAARYLDGHRDELVGVKVAKDQPMEWPRAWVMINGWPWGSDEIPDLVKTCQLELALDVLDGYDLYNRGANPNTPVTRETVDGAVTVEYAVGDAPVGRALRHGEADRLIDELTRPKAGGPMMLERA